MHFCVHKIEIQISWNMIIWNHMGSHVGNISETCRLNYKMDATTLLEKRLLHPEFRYVLGDNSYSAWLWGLKAGWKAWFYTNVKLAPDSPASYSRKWGWRIWCQLHVVKPPLWFFYVLYAVSFSAYFGKFVMTFIDIGEIWRAYLNINVGKC